MINECHFFFYSHCSFSNNFILFFKCCKMHNFPNHHDHQRFYTKQKRQLKIIVYINVLCLLLLWLLVFNHCNHFNKFATHKGPWLVNKQSYLILSYLIIYRPIFSSYRPVRWTVYEHFHRPFPPQIWYYFRRMTEYNYIRNHNLHTTKDQWHKWSYITYNYNIKWNLRASCPQCKRLL